MVTIQIPPENLINRMEGIHHIFNTILPDDMVKIADKIALNRFKVLRYLSGVVDGQLSFIFLGRTYILSRLPPSIAERCSCYNLACHTLYKG